MSVQTTLTPAVTGELLGGLVGPNRLMSDRYPVESGKRQPVHTVYGGAHLFKSDSAAKLGQVAQRVFQEYGASPAEFARAIGLAEGMAEIVHQRVAAKLAKEAVEDFRIDFEDGYGNRPDEEEDGHAVAAAEQTARGISDGSLPPFIGIRIKPLTEELSARSLRTLDLFITTAFKAAGRLPDNFVVTLPKITTVEQIHTLCKALDHLEQELGMVEGSIAIEFMIETTQSIIAPDGVSNLPRFLDAAGSRCVAAHFGTYDYTAACNITAHHQHMRHPACDFARHMMQICYSGRGIWLSDGATVIMPVPVHRASKDGPALTEAQKADNRKSVHDAWRLHVEDIRHSLVHGYYQGWDLHPGQLPTRYAALYGFFLEGLEAASVRLKNFVGKAAQATLVGDTFDDAATGQGLLNFFLRGINCGAFGEDEALATGLTLDELRSRSFVQILRNRRAGSAG